MFRNQMLRYHTYTEKRILSVEIIRLYQKGENWWKEKSFNKNTYTCKRSDRSGTVSN